MKKNVTFIFPQLYAFGEIPQIWRIRNIFKDNPLTIITYPLQQLRVDYSLYNLILRNINVVHSTDNELIWFQEDHNKEQSILEDQENIYVNLDNTRVKNLFYRMYQNKIPPHFISLSDNEIKIGKKLRNDFLIPKNAPIVTLHVRESGYKETHGIKEGYDGAPRNANIENYLPTIHYLIDKGFHVVRLGDNTMKPLPGIKGLIDAPFHPLFENVANIYFISQSKFIICCASGPNTIAELLGVPRLILNSPIHAVDHIQKNDFFVYKKYFSKKLKRFLSYEEIICSDLIYNTEINNLHIDYIENSPDEILQSVKEMIARLNGNYLKFNEMKSLNNYFINIQQKAKMFHKQEYLPLLHLFDDSNFPVSIEYLLLNQYLIKKNENNFHLHIDSRKNYYNATKPGKIKPISEATISEIKQVNKIRKILSKYNSKAYRINKPHRNILITGMLNSHIRAFGNCLKHFGNVQYIDYYNQDYNSLPDFFYDYRIKTLNENKTNETFDEDILLAHNTDLMYMHMANEHFLKTNINDYGYRIIAIICNPVKAIFEWNKIISLNITSDIQYNRLNHLLLNLKSNSNSIIDKLAMVWELYAHLFWTLKKVVKIYSHEQIMKNQSKVKKDICKYLSLSSSQNILQFHEKNEDVELYAEFFEEIIKSVESFCPTRLKFAYDNMKEHAKSHWDEWPIIFCRNVPTIQ